MSKAFNTETHSVPAIVTNTNDPEGRGRVQVQRLDQQEIPVDQCPWIYIHDQQHFPQQFGKKGQSIGASPHVLIPGAWINVPKLHSDQQTAVSAGAIATNGEDSNNGQS